MAVFFFFPSSLLRSCYCCDNWWRQGLSGICFAVLSLQLAVVPWELFSWLQCQDPIEQNLQKLHWRMRMTLILHFWPHASKIMSCHWAIPRDSAMNAFPLPFRNLFLKMKNGGHIESSWTSTLLLFNDQQLVKPNLEMNPLVCLGKLTKYSSRRRVLKIRRHMKKRDCKFQ